MGSINVLDFRIANLIAAGEVVERPASAAKELMENAVDAGASEITLEIKRGGVAFMRVTDNGCGMSREDLPVCVQRHATSKIKEASDLDGICTLGFRGEALAAISSVCDMRIMTRRKQDSLGTMMNCSYGKITDLCEVGCTVGTTVVLENMFANVPARRKFLKKDASEAMAVAAIAERVALSNPQISVRLIIDGVMKFKTPGNSQALDAIHAVFGREFSGRLNLVHGMNEGIEINGYIGRPDNVRANRNYQIIFINGRYVRSKTATAALEQAFDSFLESEKFPCCVLYITLHPAFVDVNVHPTKLEVKFSNERSVFDAVYCAVRNALMQSTQRAELQLEPDTLKPEDRSLYNAFVPVYDRVDGVEPKGVSQQKIFDMPITSSDIPDDAGSDVINSQAVSFRDANEGSAAEGAERKTGNASGREEMPTENASNLPRDGESIALNRARDRSIEISHKEEAPSKGSFRLSLDISSFDFTGAVSDERENNASSAADPKECGQEVGAFDPNCRTDDRRTDDRRTDELRTVGDPEGGESCRGDHTDRLQAVGANEGSDSGSGSGSGNDNGDGSYMFSLSSISDAQARNAADVAFGILGIAFNAYIVAQVEDKLWLIDKHAAHERILFEDMKKIMKLQEMSSQILMIPIECHLSAEETVCLSDFEKEIRALGFEFEVCENKAQITQIPTRLSCDEAADMFSAMVAALNDSTGSIESMRAQYFEKALYQASCKAAMKAGRDDDVGHQKWVVERILAIPDIKYCPHGRPVLFELTKTSIEKYFKRL